MKGLELARLFFEENRHIISGFEDISAVGLFGPGSECLGFDDEISRDHDFSADFFVLIPERFDFSAGVALARAYNTMPREFNGIAREKKSALGFSRGVMTIEAFFRSVLGSEKGPQSIYDWLYTPSYALCNASNGAVFFDGCGELTQIREHILHGMPEEVRIKKISARAAGMAQAGQYNYPRCLKHGEKGSASLALAEFARQTVEMIYLLNKKHMPFYKWCFRGGRELEILSDAVALTEALFTSPNRNLSEEIEKICALTADELRRSGISSSESDYLEAHAFNAVSKIQNQQLRNMHIMEG